MRRYLTVVLLAGCVGCSAPPATTNDTAASSTTADFERLTDDLLYGSLGLAPVNATQVGYHVHNGVQLDEQLDDFSATGIEVQRRFWAGLKMRIDALSPSSLDKEQLADLDIMKNQINLAMLELTSIQSYKHNPTIYVELAGNALFTPYMLNYAPKERRFQQITRRLEKVPALFDQAKANLTDAPEVWNRVAREENDGTIGLIDKTLRAEVPEAQKADYARAAEGALAALKDFSAYPREGSLEEDKRLAPGQGEVRRQMRLRSGHREDAGTAAGRGRGGAQDHPRRTGHARPAQNGAAGARRHREAARDAGDVHGRSQAGAHAGDGVR